jgi:signal recognition particle subunit SRP54
VFETLSDRLTQVFSTLRGRGRLSAADIDATAREIRIALLEADVALPVVREFIARVKERASGEEVSASLNPAQQVIKIVHEELVGILGGETRRLRFAKVPPTVIMLAGLQGSGKTALAAKLGLWLREQGNTPLLVAADLQRPNAVQQLQVVGERAGVPVFAPQPGNGVGDPVEVARQSREEARHRLHNVVIVDTAGRLGIDEEMMRQAADIRDAVDPDEILFVVDAMIGQDAVVTAQAFLDGVGYDGVVLTKLDGDARGGAALSIAQLTGRPVMFASSGEKLEDFDIFHPDRMASRILDMGDMLTLIEQAERAFDEDQTAAMAGKLASGEGFTLEDFVEQLAMVRKLGPIGNLLGMLPGAAQNRELLSQVNDSDLDRAAAIVNSMTPQERKNPKILNGSRRARIANGSGVTVGEVNNLVVRFLEGQKMMRQMMGGGGMPGMPAIPGMRRAAQKSVKGKKSKKKPKGGRPGGNPAAGQAPGGRVADGAAPGGKASGGVPGGRIDGGAPGNAGGGIPGGRVSGGAAPGAPGGGLPGAIPGGLGVGGRGVGGHGALTGSPEDYAASLEALAAANPAFRVPAPDKPSGTPASPANLPAGFGGFRRRNRPKKDDG